MNYRIVFSTLGKVMIIVASLMIIPILVGLYYSENFILSFIVPILILLAIGVPLSLIKIKDRSMFAKEGFVIVALCWIMLSLAGALPFVISGAIPNFIDAVFETVSGFTTTGASILNSDRVDTMYFSMRALAFWRLFTHWIGGMGVLVFVLALFPTLGDGAIHLYRAESPGPDASKLVSKITHTARILYGIYILLTLVQIILLIFSGMPLFDCVLNSFSTAGTGGFSIRGEGVAIYHSAYAETVMAVFMLIFGVNFNIYYLILIGSVAKAVKNEELRFYLIIVVSSTILIAINILSLYGDFMNSLRYSFFQVTSICSTSGLTSADFDTWPALSKGILLMLTIFGACGGSTAGGVKMSRVLILFKSGFNEIKRLVHPHAVYSVRLDGEKLSKDVERNVSSFFILWAIIVLICTLLISADPYCVNDLFTSFTATLACIGNVGPGFNGVGPMLCYGGFTGFSKSVLSIVMLLGRLEIFPMIILFSPRTWKKS